LFKKEDHEIAKSSLSDNIVELVLRNFQIEKAEFSFENVSKKMDMDTLSDMTQYGPEVFVDGPRSLQGSWSESVASLSGFCINIIHKIFTEALEKKISHHIATEKLETKFCYYPNSGALLDILKRLKAIARIVYIPSKTNAGDPISDKECFDELNEETILGCVKNEHTHYLSNYAACFVNNPQCLLFSKINLRPLSQLDKFVLDNDQWAVSLFVFATSTGSTILAGGHAMVCIEGCENGRYFRWYADLLKSGAKGAVRFIKEIEYADDKYAFNDKKGREHWRSWPLPSSNVRKMIAAIEGEENHPPDFHLLGRFHRINPIRFFSSNAEYNCIDWAIGKCQLAGVPIPNRGILSPTPYKYIESLPSSQGATLSLEERSIYPL
jgi:hypothetical protein